MAEKTPVMWGELEKWCEGQQHNCRKMRELEDQKQALIEDRERRVGLTNLQAAVNDLTNDMKTIKEMFANRRGWWLPKPILYLLCLGMIGIGLGGNKLLDLVLKALGVNYS